MRIMKLSFVICLFFLLFLIACGDSTGETAQPPPTEHIPTPPVQRFPIEDASPTHTTPPDEPGPQTRTESPLIYPEDLVYLGAFRLPDVNEASNWEYSGYAMTYYPDGDPEGADDGYPGSLVVLGHDHHQMVSEIDIPAPVISASNNPGELNTANTLQAFQDISGGLYGTLEIPRAGLEYLPAQDGQESGKLHFCWGQHFQFEPTPSHGWSELDLSAQQTAGLWYLSDYTNYITNDYMFEIPQAWADINTPGLRLATGRFRDGTWGGLGPALLAYGPWTEGNPPTPGERLDNVEVLLLYGEPVSGSPEISVSEDRSMSGFAEADEWSGGAWLTAADKTAIIFTGTKATGRNWYGFANGVEYPTSGDPDEEIPDVPDWPYDDRGWWSEDISGTILFYSPDDLAAVAAGTIETWVPQPYASMSIDEYLYDAGFDLENSKRYLLGAAAFDRERGLLYIVERRADGDKSLIHVFQVS